MVFFFLCSLLEIEGSLSLITSQGFIIEKKGESFPFIIKPYTLYLNFDEIEEIIIGDKIKVYYKENKRVPVAYKIEKLKKVFVNPDFEIKISFLKENLDNYELVDLRDWEDYIYLQIPKSKRDFKKSEKEVVFYCNDFYDEKCINKFQEILINGRGKFFFFQGGIEEWNKRGNYFYTEPEIFLRKEKINFYVIDIRDKEEREKGVVPFAFSCKLEEMDWKDFSSEKGMVPLLFYGKDEKDERAKVAAEIVLKWRYENVLNGPVSVLEGGIKKLKDIGFKLEKKEIPPFKISNFKNDLKIKLEELSKNSYFVDLRDTPDANTKFAKNIKLADLDEKIEFLPKNKEIVLFCYEGKRAKIAYLILKKIGFDVKFINEPPVF